VTGSEGRPYRDLPWAEADEDWLARKIAAEKERMADSLRTNGLRPTLTNQVSSAGKIRRVNECSTGWRWMMRADLVAARDKLRRREGIRNLGTDQSIGPVEPTSCEICQPSPCGQPLRHSQIVRAGLAGAATARVYAGLGSTI
jgi:hypothetical protein